MVERNGYLLDGLGGREMVTYKYLEARREVYEKCSAKELKPYRTFRQMQKVLKWSYWVMLATMLLCVIVGFFLVAVFPDKLFCVMPISIELLLLVIGEFMGEKKYNSVEREKELKERREQYDEYVNSINKVLCEVGINNRDLRGRLKMECKNKIELYEKSYSSISGRVFEMLVGVPLGAFISSLIYKNDTAITEQIAGLVIIGVMIIIFVRVAKKAKYFIGGYFKDQFLLSVLNEVEYSEDGGDGDNRAE